MSLSTNMEKLDFKIQLLREGHKIWKNVPPFFEITK